MDIMPTRRTPRPWMWLGVTAGLVALAWVLTYLAGGTKTPLPHMFYVPIVIASGMFGIRVGLGSALAAGVLCGPLMPLNVEFDQAQPISGWLIRLGFFLLIALVVGVGRNRLLELVDARQRFLSKVSHELRTPLASVTGFASVLDTQRDQLSEEEQREFVSLILRESTELSNVVDHYILEGRLNDSALFIDVSATDLRRVVEVVLDGMPAEVRERRVDVRGAQVVCVADPLRLRQVLRSVINNALAYTSEMVDIAVTAEGNHARLTVEEHVPSRVSGHSIRAAAPPLGVGLSVSRDLVHLMGGSLQWHVNGRVNYDIRLPLDRP